MPDTDDIREKAEEKVTLSRGELWLLRVAAATGVVSMLSHGLSFLHEIGLI
jgi:hypothetical protein